MRMQKVHTRSVNFEQALGLQQAVASNSLLVCLARTSTVDCLAKPAGIFCHPGPLSRRWEEVAKSLVLSGLCTAGGKFRPTQPSMGFSSLWNGRRVGRGRRHFLRLSTFSVMLMSACFSGDSTHGARCRTASLQCFCANSRVCSRPSLWKGCAFLWSFRHWWRHWKTLALYKHSTA